MDGSAAQCESALHHSTALLTQPMVLLRGLTVSLMAELMTDKRSPHRSS